MDIEANASDLSLLLNFPLISSTLRTLLPVDSKKSVKTIFSKKTVSDNLSPFTSNKFSFAIS